VRVELKASAGGLAKEGWRRGVPGVLSMGLADTKAARVVRAAVIVKESIVSCVVRCVVVVLLCEWLSCVERLETSSSHSRRLIYPSDRSTPPLAPPGLAWVQSRTCVSRSELQSGAS
jgi:hypothetical protein